jgi:hypothetical protein
MKFIGDEPVWAKGSVTEKNYIKEMMRGLNWHNYVAKESDYWKYLSQWVSKHAAHHIKTFDTITVSVVGPTVASIARMHLQGFPLKDHHLDQINTLIDALCAPKKRAKKTAVVVAKVVPDVQKAMRQQVTGTLSDINAEIDAAFENFEIDPPKITDIILGKGHTARHLQIVVTHMIPQIAEWQAAYNKLDEQLVEGYSYVPRRKFKQIIDGFTTVLEKIQGFISQTKTVRKVRPVNKVVLTKNLKFLPVYEQFTGEPTVSVVGATVLWIFDTKYRKILRMAGEKKGLSVKGSSITGVVKAETKMLRWPEDQLKEFARAKGKTANEWFDGVKTKNTETDTRIITKTMILLRVE